MCVHYTSDDSADKFKGVEGEGEVERGGGGRGSREGVEGEGEVERGRGSREGDKQCSRKFSLNVTRR